MVIHEVVISQRQRFNSFINVLNAFKCFSLSSLKDVVRLGINFGCRPFFRRVKTFRGEVDGPCYNELDDISIIQLTRRRQYLQLCSDHLLGHQRLQSQRIT